MIRCNRLETTSTLLSITVQDDSDLMLAEWTSLDPLRKLRGFGYSMDFYQYEKSY